MARLWHTLGVKHLYGTDTMNVQTQPSSVDRGKKKIPPVSRVQDITGNADELEPKRLELASVLQKTLEPMELITLFARELGKYVPYDGLSYHFPTLNIEINLGKLAKHQCSYDLLITDELLGNISMHRKVQFQERELAITENMLAGLLYPLRNTLLYQQALQSATMDPLTGVKNRTAMEAAMKREIGLANRHHNPLSFILFDLDHFKSINDRYGHLIGDQVLRAVARVAEDTIRDSDIIFRYGGEEFLVILHGTRISGAALLAERIRNSIENLELFPELNLHITASMGVVHLADAEDAEEIFRRADTAMYRAKHNGRNQVVIDDSV
jgi:diguanylate cyclase (GGDEF)-like protein